MLRRRNVLLFLGASFAALHMPRWITPAVAKNAEHQNAFFALSKLLTSREHLHPQTNARTFAALSAQSAAFPEQVTTLLTFAQANGINDVGRLMKAVEANAQLAPLKPVAHQIISAWYLGMVGNDANRKVIAFESALMFDPVRDATVVPSYCRAAPGYWTAPPTTKG